MRRRSSCCFPAIDLWASGLFYRPDGGFFLAQWVPFRAIYAGVPYLIAAVVVGVIALYLASLLRGRPVLRPRRRAPRSSCCWRWRSGRGCVVNTVLQGPLGPRPAGPDDRIRRRPSASPRPSCRAISASATAPSRPAIRRSGSISSPSRFLVRGARRRAAKGAAIALGAVIGLARIAQGGHFLSDVVFSGFLVFGVSWLLYRALLRDDRLARRLSASGRRGASRCRRWRCCWCCCCRWRSLDRPLARFFHDSDPTLRAVFRFITQFGLSKAISSWRADLRHLSPCRLCRARPAPGGGAGALGAARAFVFVAVAGAGLVGDILKLVFGRARPKLLFADGIFGFTWGAGHADYWSFPSGHAITIAALAVALYLLGPRGRALYLAAALLVTASRIVITAHYLSDVVMGAAIGGVAAWATWRGFARAGLDLSRPGAQPSPEAAPSER